MNKNISSIKKTNIIVVSSFLVLLLICYTLFEVSKLRSFQFFGELTSHVNTEEKVIALTFDDAPTEYTDEVLGILTEKNIKATFYAIGSNLEKYPNLGKKIVADGHEIGNHSYSHQRFVLKSQSFIDEEIQKTNALIRDTGYKGEITFRPPYGKKLLGLPWYLEQHQIRTITWDVEPDTHGTDTDFILEYTLEHTKPGSIIILHPFCDSCSGQRGALPKIIDQLQAEGYRFVTVAELLEYEGI